MLFLFPFSPLLWEKMKLKPNALGGSWPDLVAVIVCSKQAFTALHLHLSLHQLVILQGFIQTPAPQLFYSNSDFFLSLHHLPINCHLNVQYLSLAEPWFQLRTGAGVLFAFLKIHLSCTALSWLFSVSHFVYYWKCGSSHDCTSEWTHQEWLKSIIAVSLNAK